MGIGVQPNCCAPPMIYHELWKVKRFTGVRATDLIWNLFPIRTPYSSASFGDVEGAGGGWDAKHDRWYYSDFATQVKHVNSRDASDVQLLCDFGHTPEYKFIFTINVFNAVRKVLVVWNNGSWHTGESQAELWLVDMDNGMATQIAALGTARNYVPYIWGTINTESRLVVWIEQDSTSAGTAAMKQANLDGTGATTLRNSASSPAQKCPNTYSSLAVDYANQKYIFAPTNFVFGGVVDKGTIARCNWDGSGYETIYSVFDSLFPIAPDLSVGRIDDLHVHHQKARVYYSLADATTYDSGKHGIRSIALDGSGDRLEYAGHRIANPFQPTATGSFWSNARFHLGEGLTIKDDYA